MLKKSTLSLAFDIRKIAEYAAKTPNCIRADIGEPKYDPPARFTEILQELIPSETFEYAPTFGVSELIESLHDFEKSKTQYFSDPQFCVTNGAQAGIFSVCSALLETDDEILLHKAYYPPYKSIATICGAKIIETDFYQPHKIEKQITSKTKLIIINSPNNPTGDIFQEEVLKNIAEIVQKNNLMILSDDVYDRLVFFKNSPAEREDSGGSFSPISHISQFAPERTISVNSVSKSLCLTGVRIGWILGEKELISEIAKIHRNINSCPNSTFQRAVAKYLPESDSYFDEYKKEFAQRAKKISGVFDDLDWPYLIPKGAMYIWVKIPHKNSEQFVYNVIERVGVSGVPGSMFGEQSEGWVRFCFGAIDLEDIEEFGERMKEI